MNVGIIGGADGPTSIFVTTVQTNPVTISTPALLLALLGAALVGYLLGSLEFGIIVSKVFYHDDVRNHGSGNAGSTNVLRTFGVKAGVMSLIGDMGKGMVAVWLTRFVAETLLLSAFPNGVDLGAMAGFFALMGHMKPLYFGFKGGKGVAVGGGVVAAINFPVFLCLVAVFVTVFLCSRIVSLSSICAAAAYPVFTLLFCIFINGYNAVFNTVLALIMGGIVIWLHRSNIERLKNGTEYKFGQKK